MHSEDKEIRCSKLKKDVDVHRIITTSFNVELNTFIANFEPKKAYFETIRTGGLTEIRVTRSGGDIFSYYSYRLKDFREDIFLKSVNWSFPLHSFISEMDSLVDFYDEILRYTYNHDFSQKENTVLDGQLIEPLKMFLLSLDREFSTDYFHEKIRKLKRVYIKRNYELEVKVVNNHSKAIKKIDVKISALSHPESKELIGIQRTDKFGFISVVVPEGTYEAEIEKYNLRKTCELHENSRVVFVKPKKEHWWQ